MRFILMLFVFFSVLACKSKRSNENDLSAVYNEIDMSFLEFIPINSAKTMFCPVKVIHKTGQGSEFRKFSAFLNEIGSEIQSNYISHDNALKAWQASKNEVENEFKIALKQIVKLDSEENNEELKGKAEESYNKEMKYYLEKELKSTNRLNASNLNLNKRKWKYARTHAEIKALTQYEVPIEYLASNVFNAKKNLHTKFVTRKLIDGASYIVGHFRLDKLAAESLWDSILSSTEASNIDYEDIRKKCTELKLPCQTAGQAEKYIQDEINRLLKEQKETIEKENEFLASIEVMDPDIAALIDSEQMLGIDWDKVKKIERVIQGFDWELKNRLSSGANSAKHLRNQYDDLAESEAKRDSVIGKMAKVYTGGQKLLRSALGLDYETQSINFEIRKECEEYVNDYIEKVLKSEGK